MGFNPAVAFELVRTAAERGDAESQAYLGFRLAMGIYPPLPGEPRTAVEPAACAWSYRGTRPGSALSTKTCCRNALLGKNSCRQRSL